MKTIINRLVAMVAALVVASLTSCTPSAYFGGQGGGYYQPQQQVVAAQHQAGEIISSEIFGNQPTNPTPDAVIIAWDQAFGPGGMWINDFGHGRAQVQYIPASEMVLFDQYHKWAWRIKCHNRVTPVVAEQPSPVMIQPQQQTVYRQAPIYRQQLLAYQPRMVQRPQIRYCPPQPQIRYCPQPQQRMYCPPPPQCPPGMVPYQGNPYGQRRW